MGLSRSRSVICLRTKLYVGFLNFVFHHTRHCIYLNKLQIKLTATNVIDQGLITVQALSLRCCNQIIRWQCIWQSRKTKNGVAAKSSTKTIAILPFVLFTQFCTEDQRKLFIFGNSRTCQLTLQLSSISHRYSSKSHIGFSCKMAATFLLFSIPFGVLLRQN